MVYFTKDGNLVTYQTDNNLISTGTQGRIFKVSPSVCLKEYNNNESFDVYEDIGTKFNQEMFDNFKSNFGNMGMCQLYELLYDGDKNNVLGYTMKYYEEMIENILNMPVTYILDNFSLIYDLVMKLTDECIRIVDMHSRNIINTSDGMVVIDYDKYYFDMDISKDTLEYINKSALMYTFIGIFSDSLKKMGIDIDLNGDIRKRINSLFSIGTTPVLLKYKFRGYDRPIDYIVNHR